MRNKATIRLTRLAMFLALGVLLNYAEAVLLPTAFLAPGVKLGIANTVGLIVLYYFGPRDYILLGFLRVVMTSLFTGFGFNFLIGLSGWIMATVMVIIAVYYARLSIFGLSLVGAVAHGVGQILMVTLLYQTPYMINYLPILTITGTGAGLVIAYLSQRIIQRMPDWSVL
jgi:heptaprenyl diphosphate synthase